MDHEQAIAMKAVERYSLGEMSEQQAEEFELHFFSCAECSSELDTGQTFVEDARAVFGAEAESLRAPIVRTSESVAEDYSWSERIAAFFGLLTGRAAFAAATMVLAVVTSYQSLSVIPALRRAADVNREPQALVAFNLRGAVRGTAPVLAVPAGASHISLSFDPVWDDRPSSYTFTLQRQDGGEVTTFTLPPPPPGAPIAMLLPAAVVTPGTAYSLSVFAGSQSDKSREPLARYAFEVQNR